jgi:hypothetical protein
VRCSRWTILGLVDYTDNAAPSARLLGARTQPPWRTASDPVGPLVAATQASGRPILGLGLLFGAAAGLVYELVF